MASATKIMMISESPNIPKVHFSDPTVLKTSFSRILGAVVVLIDYAIGMAVGAIGGWVIGYCLGHIVLDMFEPARLESIEAIEYWYYLPLTLGRYGAVIAACISVPVAYLLSKRRMRYRMTECCNDEMSCTYDLKKDTEELFV
jgi:hypothetical protein